MSAAEKTSDETAVVIAGAPITAVTLFADGGVKTLLERLQSEVASVKKDATTESGRKAIKSLVFKIKRTKTAGDGMGKSLKEESLLLINRIDADRRVWREGCEKIEADAAAGLVAFEAAQAKRSAEFEAWLSEINHLGSFWEFEQPTEEICSARSATVEKLYAARDWVEYAQRASDARVVSLARLSTLKAEYIEKAKAAAEAERARIDAEEAARVEAARLQAEREERIAAEASETARKAAEEKARRDAEAIEEARRVQEDERVQRERIAADDARRKQEASDRALFEAEANASAALEDAKRRELAAAAKEKQRQADEIAAQKAAAAKRAADKEHMGRINREAMEDLISVLGLSEIDAKAVVVALATGKIRNAKVIY